MLDGFDDEFVIAGQVEEGSAGPRVGQLDQGLIYQRVLSNEKQVSASNTAEIRVSLGKKIKINTPHQSDWFQRSLEHSSTGFMGLPLNVYML